MTTATSPQYRKTSSGEWVVFGPAASIRVGQVNVAKRDGTTKAETVARVGKPFQVDGVECVYGYIASADRPATALRSQTRYYSGSGRCRSQGCGAQATKAGYCASCYFDEFDQ